MRKIHTICSMAQTVRDECCWCVENLHGKTTEEKLGAEGLTSSIIARTCYYRSRAQCQLQVRIYSWKTSAWDSAQIQCRGMQVDGGFGAVLQPVFISRVKGKTLSGEKAAEHSWEHLSTASCPKSCRISLWASKDLGKLHTQTGGWWEIQQSMSPDSADRHNCSGFKYIYLQFKNIKNSKEIFKSKVTGPLV